MGTPDQVLGRSGWYGFNPNPTRVEPRARSTTRENGEPYHPQRFTQMLAARATAAALPPIKLHALHDGDATTALETGVPFKMVSVRLGHSSIGITGDLYSHVSVQVARAAPIRSPLPWITSEPESHQRPSGKPTRRGPA